MTHGRSGVESHELKPDPERAVKTLIAFEAVMPGLLASILPKQRPQRQQAPEEAEYWKARAEAKRERKRLKRLSALRRGE